MSGGVGDSIVLANGRWNFSSPQIADKFDFHIQNSVPMYHQGHQLVLEISDFFLTQDSVCYDLGCATGKLTSQLAARHALLPLHIKGIDIEETMLVEARKRCLPFEHVELIRADIEELVFTTSDLIISYYTLQFLPRKARDKLISKTYNALNLGSAFLLFEKIYVENARLQDMASLLHTNLKLDNGYKPDEVVAKANSLRGILKPLSSKENISLLKKAGFSQVHPIMRYLCFEGYLAIK